MVEIPRTGSAEIDAGGRRIPITRVEQPMWPVAGLTKADLLAYYVRIAPVLLPHIAGRPLRVARFPEGVHLRGIIDSELPGVPTWMRTRNGAGAAIGDLASLLWVVNHAAVELHVPLGPDRETPTCVVLELEAGAGRGLADCCAIAVRLHRVLTGDRLAAFVKTSGAFGLHVVIPVNGGADAATIRGYGRWIAERLATHDPDLVTCDARRVSRSRRVLVDWRPNAPGRWALAPYSLRATLPGPGVSAPVDWDDVTAGASGELEALHRGPQDVLAATELDGDAWRGVLETIQELPSRG